MSSEALDARTFRNALGRFATGVAVVTAIADGGRPVGVTVSALSSLSLKPPLILVCLDHRTADFATFAEGACFAVNILADDQRAVSELFATRRDDKFQDIAWESAANGCPLLAGCLVRLECRRTATHEGGDHLIIVGEVERAQVRDGLPLLYFRGRYARLGAIL
jgi:flavin reductase (DIM6/NTAB) family NADH-FMN oxidoreductase RutF